MRAAAALRSGVSRRTLYDMAQANALERLSRGLYRLADAGEFSGHPGPLDPDLVAVASGVPGAVVCLISALAFHELTTQIPHEVYLAVAAHSRRPRLEYPPIRVFWFGAEAFAAGVETHMMDGVVGRIYSVEKTLADCFKFRNKVGLDVALEALQYYRDRHQTNVEKLLHYARICRVQRVMWPYLEALL
jgi:predicted transcriptional regulator of viral defense system